MWTAHRHRADGIRGEIIAIASGDRALSVADVLAGWRDDEAFRAFFIAELCATAYPAFFWELPPLTKETQSRPFECAVIASDSLARMHADASAFAEHLDDAETAATVAVFPNLGGDALLIAPRRMLDGSSPVKRGRGTVRSAGEDCYAHIAAFLRGAPEAQTHELFQAIAREAEQMLATTRARFWISTSGLGVPWVHVRLDSYPKYYQYRRYAT